MFFRLFLCPSSKTGGSKNKNSFSMASKIKNSFVAQVIIQSLPLLCCLFTALYTHYLGLSLALSEVLIVTSLLIPAKILDSSYLSSIVDSSLTPNKWQVFFVVIVAVLFVALIYFLQGWRWDTYTKVGFIILSCMFVPVAIYAWIRLAFEKHQRNQKRK